MHSEFCMIPSEAAQAINAAKREGRRVISVGTTSCRTLEAVADDNGLVCPFADWVNIFIYPGYRFKCVDALITNFHLPESTLIMLVSAFMGYENTMNAYKIAVQEKYRFFSFGDSMCIL
jgi:S-adenosylmethionine:tRNA ribosyltransferase-isomerase